jgi:hypothetical protein
MDHDVPERTALQSDARRADRSSHIIETGTESYRFRRTLEKKKGGKK